MALLGLCAILAFTKGSRAAQLPVCDDDSYIGIRDDTPDWWCIQNCNWDPRDCPDTHCACSTPTESPTDKPTNSPNPPTTTAPIGTYTSDCPECACSDCYPTAEPTTRPDPFDDHCHCICFGDPHCKMWNCAQNNWQGPRGIDPPGKVYLMTRCNGESLESMPFDVISSIQRYDHDFSSVDYTILKLYDVDDDSAFYCIKIKGNEAVQYNNDCSDDYDQYPDENEVISFLEDMFQLKWWNSNGYNHLVLNVDDDSCSDDLEIITQTVWSNEESVEIKVSDCYKASTCGMCGNFYDTGLYFEQIDGSHITLSEGCWSGTAIDDSALSYLIEGTMGTRRRLQNDNDTDDEPCFGLIDDIETECESMLESNYSECCEERSDFCADDIVAGCKWDACSCVMSEAESLTQASSNDVVPECVSQILAKSMNFTCNLPSDDFIVPDMSIYETATNVEEEQCEDNNASFIWIGIAIASVFWVIVNAIIYLLVIKPKLSKEYEPVSLESDTDSAVM